MNSSVEHLNVARGDLFTEEKIIELFEQNHFVVIGLYAAVFVTALFANLLVIVTVFKDKFMQNVTNYFLVNLSVADLLVALICMPNAAWRAYTDIYRFGLFTCKISAYLQFRQNEAQTQLQKEKGSYYAAVIRAGKPERPDKKPH
ncbi:hypothetical protein GWI33_014985 [Rhynchophorus ferrugineus]|uniref:G-protein coupled receptors family 1 profile domain-containing protein n=1 Tax=Rhynchophorus ferrugineus TaxID=354439 RepID=A0A834M4Y4_RHYFE|nr:hypothetical protein GWI33_014985 [Rhynchophorus ferrugineus]